MSKRIFYDRLLESNISQELARSCCFIPRSLEAYLRLEHVTLKARCITTPMLYQYATAVVEIYKKYIYDDIFHAKTLFGHDIKLQ